MLPAYKLQAWLPAATALLLLSLPGSATPTVADPAAGERVYARCMGCHSPDRNRTGPLHCGLFGRVSGTVKGYAYSEAMRDAAIIWNNKTLDHFLKAPLTAVPGTTMGFAGIADNDDRRNLIAWLATLSDASPQCSGVEKR